MSRVISNTSPLIVLAKAGLLDLLPKLFYVIVIPLSVRRTFQKNEPLPRTTAILLQLRRG